MSALISCEIRSVIRFLNVGGGSAAKIHRQLCKTYGSITMTDRRVRQWCRKEGRSDVHDEQRRGRRSVRTIHELIFPLPHAHRLRGGVPVEHPEWG